ncbi:MAG: hypothetical protein ACK58C_17165, partial [Betaproteobacteria bacterium]
RYPRAVLQAALVNIRAAVAAAAEELPWCGPFRRCPAAVQPSVQPQAGRAQARLGASFKLRDYHDQLIAAGAVTLPVLDEVIDQWLDRHAA